MRCCASARVLQAVMGVSVNVACQEELLHRALVRSLYSYKASKQTDFFSLQDLAFSQTRWSALKSLHAKQQKPGGFYSILTALDD
jgi:hypothetical protein